MRNHKLALAAVLAAAAAAAVAQVDEPTTTRAIREMSENTAVMEARLREIKIANEIDEALAKKAARESSRLGGTGGSASLDAAMPTVLYVEGVKGRLEAVLVYRNGSRQRVRVGDSVPGAVVQKVALNDVVLFDGKTKSSVRLQFMEAAEPASPVAGQSMPGYVPPVVIPQPLPQR